MAALGPCPSWRPYTKKPLQPVRLKGLELSGVPRRPLSLDGPLDLMDVIPPEPVRPNGIAGPNDSTDASTAAEAAGSRRGRATDPWPVTITERAGAGQRDLAAFRPGALYFEHPLEPSLSRPTATTDAPADRCVLRHGAALRRCRRRALRGAERVHARGRGQGRACTAPAISVFEGDTRAPNSRSRSSASCPTRSGRGAT